MKKSFFFFIFISFIALSAQEDNDTIYCKHEAINIGFNGRGISFGNSKDWNGIRFNTSDCNLGRINGLNVTF